MVLTRFQWRYGGHQVFLCGSFSSWLEHHPMMIMGDLPMVFQTVCDLQQGLHQFRFLVDGMWRCDEQVFPIVVEQGMLNNVIFIGEPNVLAPVPHYDPYVLGPMPVNDGNLLIPAAPPRHIPVESLVFITDREIEVSRNWVSGLLTNQSIFDILPLSSKVPIIDAHLPIKQAFHIMYEEGLAVVSVWDDHRITMSGMLTASDFILILQQLQNNVGLLANEELEVHSISAWKEVKIRLSRQSNGPVGLHLRPLIHVTDRDSVRDIALMILQNEISGVPIFRTVLPDATTIPLLNVASLPAILKYIYGCLENVVGSLPFLQYPICRIPIGTWLTETGRDNRRLLRVLPQSATLASALDLLLKANISSAPVVDDSGSLIDVYSRSDIIALAKDDIYTNIHLDQITMNQALDLVYQANPHYNGRNRCPTCFASTSFLDVIKQLSHPDVRRLVVINQQNRRVEGIISLRDVFKYFIG